MQEPLLVVLSTCPEAEAERLARAVVQARLAACCNHVPGLKSTYWWEGALVSEAEALLIFKVPQRCLEAMMAYLKDIHPYEVPEILAMPVERGLEAYLSWARQACGPAAP